MSVINPLSVREVLDKYILADGFEPVIDLEKSHGSWLVDARDGREYLDLFSMFASMPVGYNHPRLIAAKDRLLTAAVNKPTNSDVYTIQLAEFIDTFFNVAVPEQFAHAFFIEGGALAVENALKAAFDWKVKKNAIRNGTTMDVGSQVIHFQQCFHGRSGYTLSLTNTADARKTAHFPKFDWPRIINPKVIFPLDEENLIKVKRIEEQAIEQINDVIRSDSSDIAALIIEPIQGEGGDNFFRKEFLQSLREICDDNDIMLIFDEVQTGMGLTGKMWAWENFEVAPDLMSFGKKTQVCGFISSRRIDEVPDNVFKESSRINSTWGGNLTDMVRSTLYLEIIKEENLLEVVQENGRYLLEKLISLQEEFPDKIMNPRGMGLMCAFDLPSGEQRDELANRILNNGAFILGSGINTIRFRPPLNISPQEIDFGIDIVRSSLKQLI